MPGPRFLVLPTFAALLAVALPAPAGAEPTPSEISVARRLFDEAKAAADAGRYSEAAEKFRKAAAIKDTPGIRFHLARCEEEQGALVEALVEYDRAQELLDSGVKAPDVQRLLPQARQAVQAKLVQVTLHLPADVKDASVWLDGKPVSPAVMGVPLPVNPGRRRLRATAPGRASFDQHLVLASGEQREVSIQLPLPSASSAAAASEATSVASPASVSSTVRRHDTGIPTRTVVMVGEASLLLAGLGTGIVFTIARSSADDRFDRANRAVLAEVGGEDPNANACSMANAAAACAELEQARKDRTRTGTLATAGFITAGVSAAALGLTWLLWPSAADKPAVSAVLAPGTAQLSLRGQF